MKLQLAQRASRVFEFHLTLEGEAYNSNFQMTEEDLVFISNVILRAEYWVLNEFIFHSVLLVCFTTEFDE